MKRLIILVTILFFSLKIAVAQTLYDDVKRLKAYAVTSPDLSGNSTVSFTTQKGTTTEERKLIADTIVSTLKIYFPDIDSSVAGSSQAVTTIIEKNPFLKTASVQGLQLSGSDQTQLISLANPGAALKAVGGLGVTNIVDGFAKFIVERTKQELQAAFFDKFVEDISNPKYKDIQTLFPETFAVIKSLPKNVYSYQIYLQSLRDAFGKDLDAILPHLEDVLRNGQYKDFFSSHLELKSVCLTALYFGDGLRKGTHIGMLLEAYDPQSPDYTFTDPAADFARKNAIAFVKAVSLSLKKSNADKEYYIPSEDITAMESDEVMFNIYLAFLYQKVKDIKITQGNSLTYGDAMAKLSDDVTQIKNDISQLTGFIDAVGGQVSVLQAAIKELKNKQPKDQTIDDFVTIFNGATRVLESFTENQFINNAVAALPATDQAGPKAFLDRSAKIIDGANALLSLYSNLKQKNYSIAITNVRTLYNLRFDAGSINAGADDQKQTINKIISFLLEKGAMIAAVVEAKTSDDVYNAINAAAMPAGSARIKRLSTSNIALNAYCGLFIGREQIKGVTEPGGLNSYGLTAPIGFSLSKGNRILPWPIHGLFEAPGFSSTIFISLVDIGAVAAYRFTSTTADQVPNIQLKDIFSPGLFWSVGIPKSPLSVNLGAQVGPNLRNVTGSANTYSNNTYVRYSLSICVDIPLLNLYTK